MEQRLSRGVLLEMEGEDCHGEDQASGGDPLDGSDLAAHDQGKEFKGAVQKLESYQVKVIQSSPYHPPSQVMSYMVTHVMTLLEIPLMFYMVTHVMFLMVIPMMSYMVTHVMFLMVIPMMSYMVTSTLSVTLTQIMFLLHDLQCQNISSLLTLTSMLALIWL
ncbi:unnamed protein product [Boreogadus saida]